MTTCIDTKMCPVEDIMYSIVCNFSFGTGGYYACNSMNTCINPNGRIDCCSKSHYIKECLVWTPYLHAPTIGPSVNIQSVSCINECENMEYKIDTCYWYENIRDDAMCIENDNKYCCSHTRASCCYTNPRNAFIVFGCIAVIIIGALYYFAVREQRKKVMPVQNAAYIVAI